MHRHTSLALAALVALAALSACSEDSDPVAPKQPESRSMEFRYDFRFGAQEGGYTLKKFEYADENGAVIVVDNPTTPWDRTLTLKTGDRMYMRAEIEFDSVIWAVVQMVGPDNTYSDERGSADGPSSVVVAVDRIFK